MTKRIRQAFSDLYRGMVLEHLKWRDKSKDKNDEAAHIARDYNAYRYTLDRVRLKFEKGEPYTFEHDLHRILRFLNTNKRPELARKLREIIDGLAFQFERTQKKGLDLKDNEIRQAFSDLYRGMLLAHLRWRDKFWHHYSWREDHEAAEIARVYDACRILLDQIRLKFEKGEPYRSFQRDLDTILEFLDSYHDRHLSRSLKEIIDYLKKEESDE